MPKKNDADKLARKAFDLSATERCQLAEIVD